jgi:hypothetical protein
MQKRSRQVAVVLLISHLAAACLVTDMEGAAWLHALGVLNAVSSTQAILHRTELSAYNT